jgi:hypothetical protein
MGLLAVARSVEKARQISTVMRREAGFSVKFQQSGCNNDSWVYNQCRFGWNTGWRVSMRIRLLAALFTLMAWSSHAQDIRGMISGTVTDPGGAVVAGATVTVTNTGTNVSTPLTTNASGYYEAPLLPGGQYQITVEAPGFKKVVRSSLTLRMSDKLDIDVKLEVGALNESVTITAESPILDTSSINTG